MGILKNTKEYIANKVSGAAKKAADGVAKAASLSPSQIEAIDKKRDEYFAKKPDMNSEDVKELITKDLGAVSIEVYQAYLENLKTLYAPVTGNVSKFNSKNRIRYFDITKWVTDPKEKNLDKLVNVYQVLSREDCNIALIYDRKKDKCKVTMAAVNTDENDADPTNARTFIERLKGAVHGNFPGAEISDCKPGEPPCLEDAAKNTNGKKSVKSVAIVSNLASEKSEGFISQSMEKLLDGIVPANKEEEYTIVLLAKPVSDQLAAKNRLFELYSRLAPYAAWQTNYAVNVSDLSGSSATVGLNLGMNIGRYSGSSANTSVGIPNAGRSRGKNLGMNIGGNFGVNFARSSNVMVQVGKNESVTQTYTNFGVKHTLDVIEKQLKRLEESSALGMWEFAAYIIAQSPVTANNVAHMYLALTQGEDSHITQAAVNLWDGEKEKEQAAVILENVQKLNHPVFGLKYDADSDADILMYPILVTPSAELSGKELAKALNFPRKSVGGLPVLETTPFGREVQKYTSTEKTEQGREITIGSIYHMRQKENTQVQLSVDDLASHTFITGSTGTGKSNTVYQLLKKLNKKNVKFLVVEPAKGEYKNVLGGACKVYGTNSNETELLRVNPFFFPREIHVLEHIDRLVEIFNACWPMYAAMPAVLKDAIEKSYERVGWNLRFSKCEPRKYPTFKDVMKTLPEVMGSSLYSADTKSDYAGALITRVRSLTNGINGQIFCSGTGISDKEIFDKNVIVDLHRIGSTETKALLMGILVMKLQEYHMKPDDMNSKLKHVTVLEEAHNLLRRTSTQQLQEGANLQGKSVEMITNSIAEMRTYGEGFIIADQSPELLDEAVIRNTNTKIVFRLPDKVDRDLVGTSMALNNEQITELAKLPKGVAAVYQNDWLEAVLCQFEKYTNNNKYKFTPINNNTAFDKYFSFVFGVNNILGLNKEEKKLISDWLDGLDESFEIIKVLRSALEGSSVSEKDRKVIAYNIFDGKKIALLLEEERDEEKGIDNADKKIRSVCGFTTQDVVDEIRHSILSIIFQISNDGEIKRRYKELEEGRRLL